MVSAWTAVWRVACSLAVAVTGLPAAEPVGVTEIESTTTGSVEVLGMAQAAAPVPVAASAMPSARKRRPPGVLRRCFECFAIRGRTLSFPPRLWTRSSLKEGWSVCKLDAPDGPAALIMHLAKSPGRMGFRDAAIGRL